MKKFLFLSRETKNANKFILLISSAFKSFLIDYFSAFSSFLDFYIKP